MSKKILITGGAGFIGVNAAAAFARDGWKVSVFDNGMRRGADLNVRWLTNHYSCGVTRADIRNYSALETICRDERFDAVLHLAAQTAVTKSVRDPRTDFEINALGTLNLLEAVRHQCPDAAVVYSSTNKVYGEMQDIPVVETHEGYSYTSCPHGIAETQPLDFHSPYGCSKGAGDQYVSDYARIYGLRTATFRQSCIYGPRQFGIEDQGWLAWFSIAAITGKPITIYGDGKQIRDVLHVDDLVDAYKKVINTPEALAGHAFNIGGGPGNTLSLLEVLALLESCLGRPIPTLRAEWRPGDQRIFVCNISKAKTVLGWTPQIDAREGVLRLWDWINESRPEIDRAFAT